MELKLTKTHITVRMEDNPFEKRKTDSGIILISGGADSQETGQYEQLTKIIGFGIVTNAGPDCKYVKEGDGVFFDTRSIRPLPFKEVQWQLTEDIIMGYVLNNDGELENVLATFKEERETEERKTALAIPSAKVGGIMLDGIL